MSKRQGPNLVRMETLIAVQRGIRAHSRLRRHDTKYATSVVEAVIDKLVAEGLLTAAMIRGERHYQITAAGQARIPASELAGDWFRPLVIARRPPVREGAQAFRALPSIAAGTQYGWRHPV